MPSACHWMKLAAGERYLNKSSPDKLVSKIVNSGRQCVNSSFMFVSLKISLIYWEFA